MTKENSLNVRSRELYAEATIKNATETDRLFSLLMIFQWLSLVVIQNDDHFEVDQEISFVISGDEKISGTGRVKWVRRNKSLPDGIGIEIMSFTNESHLYYEKWLEILPLRPYIPKTKAA